MKSNLALDLRALFLGPHILNSSQFPTRAATHRHLLVITEEREEWKVPHHMISENPIIFRISFESGN